jgi:hypothetical protein
MVGVDEKLLNETVVQSTRQGGGSASKTALAELILSHKRRAGGGAEAEEALRPPGAVNRGAITGQQEPGGEVRPPAVSHFCACIGSPCLRHCVHGAPIIGGGGGGGCR